MYNNDDNEQKYKNEQEKLNEFLKKNMNGDNKFVVEFAQDMPYYMQMINAFRSSKRYIMYLSIKGGRVALYFFFMTFIAALFSVFIPLAGRVLGVGGVSNFINERVPDFTYENGVLLSDSPMQYEKQGIQFYLDTNVDKYSKDDVDKDAVLQVLVSKTNMVLYEEGRVAETEFADFPEFTFSKKILLDNTPIIYAFLVSAAFVSYVSLMFSAIFTALMLTVVGLLLSTMNKFEIKYSEMLKLAIYASTISTMLSAVFTSIPIISAGMISIIGIVWTSLAYFNALIRCGFFKKLLKEI